MKKSISKTEALMKIREYFEKDNLSTEKTRKMKRLAMKFNIKLGRYRARFCKKCLGDLKHGKVRVTKTHKVVVCECGHVNKIRIK